MLSIVIVNFKNPALLRLCLKSLNQVLKKDFEKEIIVIDVAGSIQTRNVITEEFPQTKLFPFKDNIGFTRGVNEGIKQSSGDNILLLNPDIIALPGAVEDMYSFMKANPKIGILGPKLLNFDGSDQDSCFRFPAPITFVYRRTILSKLPFAKKHLDHFLMHDADRSKVLEVDWLFGSPIMISHAGIDKVGLMDERFFLYLSDIDWPRRFWENGFKVVYYPFSKMYHYHIRHSKGRYGLLDFILKPEGRWHLMDAIRYFKKYMNTIRSEERRVGKECRSRW